MAKNDKKTKNDENVEKEQQPQQAYPNQEHCKNIANNTLVFLDQVKLSPVGDENRKRIQAMIQSAQLMEAIASGELIIVPAEKEK